MTIVLSWKNSISLSPATFCIPTPNLLLLQVFPTSYFSIPVPYDEKDIFSLVLVSEGLIHLHRTFQPQLLRH